MKNEPDERSVYLALNSVFRGTDAQLRKSKKIRDLVLQHRHNINVRSLIDAHNIQNVCSVVKRLLEQQVFQSPLKAKIRFPEVFEVSPAQSAERSASEREAARSELDAIRIVAGGRLQAARSPEDGGSFAEAGNIQELTAAPHSMTLTGKGKQKGSSLNAPSLYPLYLPYQAQHKLLITAQGLLEVACYSFAARALPQLIQSEGWDCAEAVELNIWARLFESRSDAFIEEDVSELGKPSKALFESIAQLRHTAVHRIRVSAHRLEQFLSDAESLCRLLGEPSYTQKLSRLRRETQVAVQDIEANKDLLESQLTTKLKKISAQRAELDRQEHSAIVDMLKEDEEYRNFAGNTLAQTIELPDTARHSVAATDLDPSSDTDVVGIRASDTDTDTCKDDWEA